jgi:hypothetical protein
VEFLATSFALGAGSFVCPSIHEVLGRAFSCAAAGAEAPHPPRRGLGLGFGFREQRAESREAGDGETDSGRLGAQLLAGCSMGRPNSELRVEVERSTVHCSTRSSDGRTDGRTGGGGGGGQEPPTALGLYGMIWTSVVRACACVCLSAAAVSFPE